MKHDLEEIVKQMTLEEKAGLCSGKNFWETKPVERLGVASILMTDGPHGLRKQEDTADQLGISISVPATCFPTASTTSCSFDRELLREIGIAIAEEMLQEKVAVVLGPGLNIKRSPLCGRNFEYFSEDPLLAGELAAAMVRGIQSKGVGACLKHFAGNNQEAARMINDSLIDERALREIYLTGFEIAVKKSQPWTMMCAYNKVNVTYMCENEHILTDIARDEWGFKGAIMTDWGAMDERVWALKSGLDLEMPFTGFENDKKIVAAVRAGSLDEKVLDRAVLRMLEIVEAYKANTHAGEPYDIAAHDAFARRVVCESAVLLKNESILPLKEGISLAVIGEFASKPRYQGAGSSKINPHKITSALETLDAEGIAYDYARGYDLSKKEESVSLIAEAVETARGKDAVIIFAGLPDEYESEGFDRTNIDLPAVQNQLIESIAAVNPNIVVVLHNGSAVRLPWLGQVKAVLLLGLGGQCVGAAAVDLLFGSANPSGKLSETYPLALEDNPSYKHFGERFYTQYRESVYVGYRYYEKAGKVVQFPFGHGLSYTQFEFSDLKLSKQSLRDDETLAVTLKVKNTGSLAGKEVVQIYVAAPHSSLFKPEKELRDFGKVHLEPGEEKELQFELEKRAFAYWNVAINDWHVESGSYTIMAGSSSQDIRLSAQVTLLSTCEDAPVPDYRQAAPQYYSLPSGTLDIPLEQFEAIYGAKMPPDGKPSKPFTRQSTLYDARDTFMGKLLIKIFGNQMRKAVGGEDGADESMMLMMESMILEFPIRSFGMMGMPSAVVDGILDLLNTKVISGLGKLLKGNKKA